MQADSTRHSPTGDRQAGLVIGAIGIVFGDIGTSPLYTLRECFSETGGLPLDVASILGVLSLIFWAIFLIVTLKYVVVIMRADNRGEGGILALTALALRRVNPRRPELIVALGMFGAALFYGDGVITPAISVLSAVEGLKVATPLFEPYVVPITIAILVLLFVFQRGGTARVGALFGPVMVVWFVTLGTLGLVQVVQEPRVLGAINPAHAAALFAHHRWVAFLALGAVVLAVTGAEALYADMGHFGRRPIRLAWFGLVLPALVLNYFGQGALLMRDPSAVTHPFYLLVPSWGLLPLVALATAATVIASQAVISGAFSLSRQAVQLGYLPRLEVHHTSESAIGQIYVPRVNWTLLAAIIALVLGFQSSSNLAAAYGIAVTATMAIDAVLAYGVARHKWGWRKPVALVVFGLFLTVDLAFFSANTVKILAGGWFPLVVATLVFLLMSTWRRGRQVLFDRLYRDAMPLKLFLEQIGRRPPTRVPGTAVFMTGTRGIVPHALLHNLKHNKVLHERVVLMTVNTEDVPRLTDDQRIEIRHLGQNFHRAIIRFGFMETPNVPRALELCRVHGLDFNMMDTSFFLSRENFVPSAMPDMSPWREHVFITLSSNALSATDFFCIPPNRVVELGTQIEI